MLALELLDALNPGAHIRAGVGGCDTPPTIENRLKKSVPNCPSDIFFGPDRPVKILCNIRVQENKTGYKISD